MVGGSYPSDVPAVATASAEFDSEVVDMTIVEDLVGSSEGTLDVIILIDVSVHVLA